MWNENTRPPMLVETLKLRQRLFQTAAKHNWKSIVRSQCSNDFVSQHNFTELLEGLGVNLSRGRISKVWAELLEYQAWSDPTEPSDTLRNVDVQLEILMDVLHLRQGTSELSVSGNTSWVSKYAAVKHDSAHKKRSTPMPTTLVELEDSLRELLMRSTTQQLRQTRKRNRGIGSRNYRNLVPAFLFFSQGENYITCSGFTVALNQLGLTNSNKSLSPILCKLLFKRLQENKGKRFLTYCEFTNWLLNTDSDTRTDTKFGECQTGRTSTELHSHIWLRVGMYLQKRRSSRNPETMQPKSIYPIQQKHEECLKGAESQQYNGEGWENDSVTSLLSEDFSSLESVTSSWSDELQRVAVHDDVKGPSRRGRVHWLHSDAANYAWKQTGAATNETKAPASSCVVDSTQQDHIENNVGRTLRNRSATNCGKLQCKRTHLHSDLNQDSETTTTCVTTDQRQSLHSPHNHGRRKSEEPKSKDGKEKIDHGMLAIQGWSWVDSKAALQDVYVEFSTEDRRLPKRHLPQFLETLGVRLSETDIQTLTHDLFITKCDTITFKAFYKWITSDHVKSQNLEFVWNRTVPENYAMDEEKCPLTVASMKSAAAFTRKTQKLLAVKVLRRRLRYLRREQSQTLKSMLGNFLDVEWSQQRATNKKISKENLRKFLQIYVGFEVNQTSELFDAIWSLIVSDVRKQQTISVCDLYGFLSACFAGTHVLDSSAQSASSDASEWSYNNGTTAVQPVQRNGSTSMISSSSQNSNLPKDLVNRKKVVSAQQSQGITSNTKQSMTMGSCCRIERLQGVLYFVDRSCLPPKVYTVSPHPNDETIKLKGKFVGKLKRQKVIARKCTVIEGIDRYALDSDTSGEYSEHSVLSDEGGDSISSVTEEQTGTDTPTPQTNSITRTYNLLPIIVQTAQNGLLRSGQCYYLWVDNSRCPTQLTTRKKPPGIQISVSERDTSTTIATIQWKNSRTMTKLLKSDYFTDQSRRAGRRRKQDGWVEIVLKESLVNKYPCELNISLRQTRSRLLGGDIVVAKGTVSLEGMKPRTTEERAVFLHPVTKRNWRSKLPPIVCKLLVRVDSPSARNKAT